MTNNDFVIDGDFVFELKEKQGSEGLFDSVIIHPFRSSNCIIHTFELPFETTTISIQALIQALVPI